MWGQENQAISPMGVVEGGGVQALWPKRFVCLLRPDIFSSFWGPRTRSRVPVAAKHHRAVKNGQSERRKEPPGLAAWNMTAIKPTNKQSNFIAEYLQCLNGAKAARRAGYSVRSARQQAYENLRKPHIRDVILWHLTRRSVRLALAARLISVGEPGGTGDKGTYKACSPRTWG